MFLDADEIAAIDARIAAIEAASGVEVVTAVVGKSDAYPELPWTAFALGAALAALALGVSDALRPDWVVAHAALVAAVTILGAGGAFALAAVFVPAFARLFLGAARRELEVRQYARTLFLDRELFRTRQRTGILILVSVFERRVELVADTGFAGRVTGGDWQRVVQRMTTVLAGARPAAALEEGLAALGGLLAQHGYRAEAGDVDELPDAPIELEGE
jgi:putative membrane protein